MVDKKTGYSLADVFAAELGMGEEDSSATNTSDATIAKEDEKVKTNVVNKEEFEMKKDVKVNEVKQEVKEEVIKEKENVEMKKQDVKQEEKVMAEVLYFVLGRNGDTISAVNVRGTNQVQMRKVTSGDIHTPTALLCLEEVNNIMSKIKAKKDEGYIIEQPMPIRTVNVLIQSINTGTYKYWIRTGKYADGRPVAERELNAWKEFAMLYQELFLDINFYKQNISRKDNRPMANVERAIIAKIWDNLPTQRVDTGAHIQISQ